MAILDGSINLSLVMKLLLTCVSLVISWRGLSPPSTLARKKVSFALRQVRHHIREGSKLYIIARLLLSSKMKFFLIKCQPFSPTAVLGLWRILWWACRITYLHPKRLSMKLRKRGNTQPHQKRSESIRRVHAEE